MSDLVLIEPTEASIETADGVVPVREVALGSTPRGLAVVLHDPATPAVEIVEAMNRLALDGYESLAAVADVRSLPDLMRRAAERGWDSEQIGMIGLGHGGTVVLAAAQEMVFGAAVSISAEPDVARVCAAPILRTPWLGLFGEQGGPTAEEVGALARALETGSDVFSRLVVYPGVGRDFHRGTESGIRYSASYDGWQRTSEWLNARVASRLTPLAVAWRARQSAVAG